MAKPTKTEIDRVICGCVVILAPVFVFFLWIVICLSFVGPSLLEALGW